MPRKQIDDNSDDLTVGIRTDEVDESIREEMDELQAAIADIAANASKIRVLRRNAHNQLAYLDDFNPKVFDLALIRDQFGGGNYLAQAIGSNGRIMKRVPFYIDECHKPKIQTVAVAPSPAASQDGKLMEILLLQNQQHQSMFQNLMQVMGAAMVAAMSGNKRESGSTIDELLKWKQVFPDNTDKALTMFRAGLEFSKDEKHDDEPFWKEIVRAVAPAAAPLMAGAMGMRPAINQPVATLPNGQPITNEQQMFIIDVQRIVSELTQRAQQNADVNDTAEWLATAVESLEGKYRGHVNVEKCVKFLEQANWWTNLLNAYPLAAPMKDYLHKLRDAILSLFEDTPADAATSKTTANPNESPDSTNGTGAGAA